MTVGFDGSRAFHKDRTGTENYSYQLLKALSKLDHENRYIVYLRPGTKGDALQDWPENFEFKTINFPRLWTQVGLAGQTFKEKLDVLFIPAHTSPLIHKPGLKTVVTVHDLGAEYLPKMHQIKQRLYLKWITNYQLKNATKLIAVSEATKEDLVKKVGIDSKKIKVIYEGVNISLFKSSEYDSLVNILREFDLKKGEYFLFVGTVQPRKNLERLIRAYHKFIYEEKKVNEQVDSISYIVYRGKDKKSQYTKYNIQNTKLVIIGSKGWLADPIYELPKKLGIESNVKFLGRVPDDKLPSLYRGAKALLFPSLFEGFGLPILEAQASGTPVLTSDHSSMPEVAGKGAILVDPYSVEAIAGGIREISEKGKVQREKLVKAGFENVKRFSWEKSARETLQVLENVV